MLPLMFLELPYLAPAYIYAGKTFLCGISFLLLKPWQYYEKGNFSDVLWGIFIGIVVAFLWIFPETPLVGKWSFEFQKNYNLWAIMMPGSFPSYYSPELAPALPPGHASLAFSPEMCGWTLTIVKLFGSAFVIAILEEYFFRGFLYRWFQNAIFLKVPLKNFDLHAFLLVLLCFSLEHDRWLGGLIAGIAYGWLAVFTGRLRASITAHVVTNLLLGIYIIYSKQYGFW